jgi:hypothetical protein
MRSRYPLLVLLLLLLQVGGVSAASAHATHHPNHHHKHHTKHHTKHPQPPVHAAQTGPLPYMGPEPGPSLFGIDTDLYDSNNSYWAKDIPLAGQMGSRFDHFVLGPATASGNFAEPDYVITQARNAGMGVVLSFGGIPQACSITPPPSNIHACPPTTPADLATYQAYMRTVLLRYRNVVSYYESWVEPNNGGQWLPGPQPEQYAALLEAQYQTVQQVNAQYGLDIKLLFGSPINFSYIPGTANATAVLPFVEAVLADLHGQMPFDGVALHGYRFPPATEGPLAQDWDYVGGVPNAPGSTGPFPAEGCHTTPWCQMTWAQELSAYEQEFVNHGYGQVPMWLTEFGWPGNSVAGGDYFPDEVTQAQYLTQAYGVLLSLPFVQAALWFNLRDYQPGYATSDPAFFYHYGLVEYGFTPKPAAAAFTALATANPGR